MEDQNQNGAAIAEQTSPNLSILKPEETAEQRIKEEIKRFSLPDRKIAEMKKKFAKLTVRPLPAPDDKEGLKLYREEKEAVREALQIVRKVRTGLEGKRKELKSDYLKIGKGIDAEAARLTNLVEPIEEPLKTMFDAAEASEAARKREADEAAQIKLQGRVNELIDAGIRFEGSFYAIGDISVDVVTLKDISDEKFDELKARVVAKKGEETAAEEARLKLEAEEKENARLEKLKLEEDQRKFKVEQDEFRRQKEELENQKIAARNEMIQGRRGILEGMGLVWNSALQHYSIANPSGRVEVKLQEITESDSEGWGNIVSSVTKLIGDLQEKEASRLEEVRLQEEAAQKIKIRTEARIRELQGLNFVFYPAEKVLRFTLPKTIPLAVDEAFLEQSAEEDWVKAVANWIAGIAEMTEQSLKLQKEEADQIEVFRKKALSDRQACEEYVDQLMGVAVPAVTDPEMKALIVSLFQPMKDAKLKLMAN